MDRDALIKLAVQAKGVYDRDRRLLRGLLPSMGKWLSVVLGGKPHYETAMDGTELDTFINTGYAQGCWRMSKAGTMSTYSYGKGEERRTVVMEVTFRIVEE